MNNPHHDLRLALKSSSASRSRSLIDVDEILMLTAMFISATVRGRFAAKTIHKAFRTIGSSLDLLRIFLVCVGNTPWEICIIEDSMPFLVFLKSFDSKKSNTR